MEIHQKFSKLKDQDLRLVLLRRIPLTQFGPSKQLQQGEMCVFHVKDTALLLVNVRSINDNALQLVQFQIACAAQVSNRFGTIYDCGQLT